MTSTLGQDLARVEGRDKVTGAARYAVEHPVEDVAYAWVVQSTIAKGRLLVVDTSEALAAPGVRAVLTHTSAPALGEVDDPELLVLQSDRVAYRGQAVALVVADTEEQAREASGLVRVLYDVEEHDVTLSEDSPGLYAPEVVNPSFPAESGRGDPDTVFASSPVQVDQRYRTAALFNAPMEPHGTTARWTDGRLVVQDSTQHPSGVAGDLATLFDLDDDGVDVFAHHVGGGFGSKGSARPNVVLAAMAAREVGRPVRLALPRQATFAMVGYRTPTLQHLKLGADADGRLRSVSHDVWEQTSSIFEFAEQTAVATRHMYAVPDLRTTHELAPLDVPTPRWMRAPGEAPGMFALESAMDELAEACGVDPIELRRRNEPSEDPDTGEPFSSRNLLECLRVGAERFGWDQRDPRPGVRREGRWLVGTGVASATYPAMAMPSSARIRRAPDGCFDVAIAATDIGTGARTVLLQIAGDALGVPLDQVRISIGDSTLPQASVAGGSAGTSSWGWAITKAAEQLLGDGGDEATFDTTDLLGERADAPRHAFGAQFVEVRVDAVTGEVRVPRMLGVFAAGRILNPRLARSQFLGAMTMGLGMALHEEGVMDALLGDFANHDFATYHLPSNADVLDHEVLWVDEQDDDLNPMGSKGIGEIGIVGTAAAVANAVWHATGVRVRDLPIQVQKVLPGLPPL